MRPLFADLVTIIVKSFRSADTVICLLSKIGLECVLVTIYYEEKDLLYRAGFFEGVPTAALS